MEVCVLFRHPLDVRIVVEKLDPKPEPVRQHAAQRVEVGNRFRESVEGLPDAIQGVLPNLDQWIAPAWKPEIAGELVHRGIIT